MDPRTQNRPNRSEVKPVELDRWEGEGGNPPRIGAARRVEPAHSVTGILRRLLIDWHWINSPSSKT